MGIIEDLGIDALFNILPKNVWMYFAGIAGLIILCIYFLLKNNVMKDIVGNDSRMDGIGKTYGDFFSRLK